MKTYNFLPSFRSLFAASALLGVAIAAAAAPVLHVSSEGALLGADHVLVGDLHYSVRFMDGTCAALFAGCDSNEDFVFRSAQTAGAASQALLDQVLVNVPGLGSFDSEYALTNGCLLNSRDYCIVVTPWGRVVNSNFIALSGAFNDRDPAADSALANFGTTTPMRDFSELSYETWAVWARGEPPSALVPEPGSLALGVLALAGLVATRRTRL